MGVSRLYKFGTPYNADQLSGLSYAQAANLMYFAHVDRPVNKLTRLGHTDWSFDEVTFGPTIAVPTGVGVTPSYSVAGTTVPYSYVVTAIDEDTGQESRASAVGSTSNDLTLDGNFNTISWSAVAGAERYVVYKNNNGIYGYIGGTEGLSFQDGSPVIIANLSDTPPKGQNPFDAVGKYPSVLGLHQQRLLLGSTLTNPNAIWGSQSGDLENMDYSRPAKADDAFSFALVGKRANTVTQLVSSTSLLALTTDGITSLTGANGNALGDGSPVTKKESSRGASRLPAIEVDEVIFFQPNQGSMVRALGFSFEIEGFRSNDVTIFSPHLFQGDTIVSWAYQTDPYSCIWAAMQSGLLLCFTWEKEQDVWGWTVCETQGRVLCVAAITESGVDRIYAIIERDIGGAVKRFYERMALPHGGDYATACHLDCAVTQVFDTPSAVISGLGHLEGETVSAFYDGYVAEGLVVVNGEVTLPWEATIATVGLPYVAEIETLELTLTGSNGSQHVNRQTIGKATLRAIDTKGVEMAVNGSEFEPLPERQNEAMGVLPNIESRDYKVPLPSTWSDGATLVIRQTQPLPMHITGLFVEPEIGDD